MKKFYEDEEYIKMCEKADLIPTFAIWTIGYLEPGIVWQDGNCFYNQYSISMPSNNDKLIWIPRQDQLQEMLPEDYDVDVPYNMIDCIQSEINDFEMYPYVSGGGGAIDGWSIKKYYQQFTSFEQLLLSLVMKEKYNKTWNGEEWVSE